LTRPFPSGKASHCLYASPSRPICPGISVACTSLWDPRKRRPRRVEFAGTGSRWGLNGGQDPGTVVPRSPASTVHLDLISPGGILGHSSIERGGRTECHACLQEGIMARLFGHGFGRGDGTLPPAPSSHRKSVKRKVSGVRPLPTGYRADVVPEVDEFTSARPPGAWPPRIEPEGRSVQGSEN